MTLTVLDFGELIEGCRYKDGYELELRHDPCPSGTEPDERRWFVQAVFERLDIATGILGKGYGGKRYLSKHMVPSEVVRVCFGAFLSLEEHECREWFRWGPRGETPRRIFGPHIDVHALHSVARQIDVRPPSS